MFLQASAYLLALVKDVRAFPRMALPPGLKFLTKGELSIEILAEAYADGLFFDFICGDVVYGACTRLRGYLEPVR